MSTLTEDLRSAIDEVLVALRGLEEFPRYSEVVARPGPPATANQIAALQQRIGLPLPPSYRQFLTWHNGYRWLAYPGHMLSIEELSPGGEYWENIVEWKRETAEYGYGEVLDGLVIAYLDQPNNWVYLDPNQINANGEWAVMLYVPGVDPSDYPDLQSLLRACARNARTSREWTLQRADKGGPSLI